MQKADRAFRNILVKQLSTKCLFARLPEIAEKGASRSRIRQRHIAGINLMKSLHIQSRLLLACLSLGLGAAQAATPESGTLTPTSGPISYTAGPFAQANPTPVPLVDTGPTCDDPAPACDSFELTVSLPAGYVAANNANSVKVSLSWEDSGSGSSDYDLDIYAGQVATTDGATTPPYNSSSAANPEIANIFPLADGDTIYTIKVVPYTPTGEVITTTIELVSAAGVVTNPDFGKPDAVTPGVARYQNYEPFGLIAEAGNGECNIGFNPITFKLMFMCFGGGQVYRITTPERLATPLPEACPAVWEDVTPLATSGPQPVADPILYTDAVSGRTWASNLTAGPNVSYAFTSNDGGLWVNAGGGGVAGADHQTIGSGPYPPSFVLPHPLHVNAVYFCSQFIAGPAGCVRSDDGGASYGPTTLAYNGQGACSGLHGHVRVAKSGAVWLPVANCGTGTGYSISTDAGMTWAEHVVPNTLGGGGNDPSIALDDDSTAYFCYTNGDGHIRVATSKDNGATWENDTDLGITHELKNSAFPEAWAGSSGRAACGFLGTDRQGNVESIDFPGLWYGFIAHTYDGGKTWKTTITTPGNPIQGVGGVWHSGGSNPNRNLLDFNEATADEQGRFIYGYDDGCVRDCALDPRNNPQSFTAMMAFKRQSGGKTLRAEFDRPEPHAPANACLAGVMRNQAKSTLSWREPDHGGAAIANYKVFRSTSPDGPFVFLGDAGPKSTYADTTADPNVEKYYYRITAINSSGEGIPSNVIELPILVTLPEVACQLPGLTVLTSPTGVTGNGGLPTGQDDLRQAWFAEPAEMPGKLVISMKMASLSPQPPPGYRWIMYFSVPGDTNAYFAAMDTAGQATPRFIYGTRSAISTPAAEVGSFTVLGTIDAASNFNTDGTIQLVIDKASFPTPITTGMELSGIAASIRQTSNPQNGAGLTVDAATGANYTVVDNLCQTLSNLAPLPLLEATPTSGAAPLMVGFTISGTDMDSGDTIASYSIDFGDGQKLSDQPITSLPVKLSHNYANPRNYIATLTVKDSRGLVSSTVAQQSITATKAGAPGAGASQATGRFGGAFGLALLPLLFFVRRRRR